jgi:hypothetical protein
MRGPETMSANPMAGCVLALVVIGVTAIAEPAAAQSAPERDAATLVEGVTITGSRDWRLIVEVEGAQSPEWLVSSRPVTGISCGDPRWSYHPHQSPRLCWLRRAPGTEVVLNAMAPTGGWRIEWTGCEPFGDGRSCRLTLTEADQVVRARFVP